MNTINTRNNHDLTPNQIFSKLGRYFGVNHQAIQEMIKRDNQYSGTKNVIEQTNISAINIIH